MAINNFSGFFQIIKDGIFYDVIFSYSSEEDVNPNGHVFESEELCKNFFNSFKSCYLCIYIENFQLSFFEWIPETIDSMHLSFSQENLNSRTTLNWSVYLTKFRELITLTIFNADIVSTSSMNLNWLKNLRLSNVSIYLNDLTALVPESMDLGGVKLSDCISSGFIPTFLFVSKLKIRSEILKKDFLRFPIIVSVTVSECDSKTSFKSLENAKEVTLHCVETVNVNELKYCENLTIFCSSKKVKILGLQSLKNLKNYEIR